jgi:peptidoglycan/LPS O-acetylase OafA/YrhL
LAGQFATFGVQVFFVISGYLITRLLQQEQERNGRISLPAFYRRRFFRIFPAAYTYIAIIAIVSPASRRGLLFALTYLTSYRATSTPNLYTHLWSLSVEEQFYLLWPLALVLGYRYRARIAWSAMLAAAVFRLMIAFSSYAQAGYIHYSFPGTMDSIAAGCLLAIYEPRLAGFAAKFSEVTGVLLLACSAFVLEFVLWGSPYSNLTRGACALAGMVPMLVAGCIFLLVQREDWILNNPVASTIGVLSYSLYLWQQPFTREGWPVWAGLLLLFGCAIASYLLVEKPMLRLGASFGRKRGLEGTSVVSLFTIHGR